MAFLALLALPAVACDLGTIAATAGGADAGLDDDVRFPTEDSPDDRTDVDPVAVVIGTQGVGHRLRAGPSGESELLTVMPDHQVLEILGPAEGGWWPVRYRETDGWAHQRRLEIVDSEADLELTGGFNFLLPWRNGIAWPVTQGHGGFSHDGISKWAWDFGMPKGTPVVASHSGVVRMVRGDSRRGGCSRSYVYDANFVTIDRGDGLESHYVHLDSVAVSRGEHVRRGQRIGTSGTTGYSCGAHLHFQIQLSPSGGGTNSGANQSVHAYFWDTGERLDPPYGTRPRSRNNSTDVP